MLIASLDLLHDADRTRLYGLGIFKDDQDVPVSSVMALWGMDDLDSEELLTKFARLSLIKYRSSTAYIRLHDVVREYFLTKLPSIPATHDQLLRGYGDPYTLPDVYAWRFYAYHLNGAGRLAELRPLIVSYRWLERKLSHTDPNALIEDYDLWLTQGRDEPIRLIQSSVSNSAHVLEKDKSALAHQLAGRLMHHYQTVGEIRVFMDVVMTTPNNLFPMNPASEYDIMNPAGGMLLRTMKHEGWVHGAVQLRDGKILSWGQDTTLRLWQPDGTPIATLTGYTESVLGAVELSDGRILSWSEGNTLRLWDSDGAEIATLTGHTDDVRGAVELGDGRLLSWAGTPDGEGEDNTLRLWDRDGVAIATLMGHTESVLGAVELGDGRLLSWAGNPYPYDESKDNTLRLWDNDGVEVATLTGHTDWVRGGVELGDGRLLSWSNDNTLCLWDSDGVGIATLTEHTSGVLGAVELDDGRLLSWSEDKTLCLWDSDGARISTLTGHTNRVSGAVELGDGRLLSWAGTPYKEGKDNTLRLWDSDGVAIVTLTGHTDIVWGAVELGDGRLLSWSWDNTLRLWDADGSPIATLTGHRREVPGAVELGDGRLLSWSWDETLRLWDADGVPIATLTGHTSWVNGAVELGDGQLLSWSFDKTLRLWESDGTPIDVLGQDYRSGDREIISAWAKKHGYMLDDFYPPENDEDPLMAGEYVKWQWDSTDLIIYDSQTGKTVHTFYGDAPFSMYRVVFGGRIVVAGDMLGRVIFLRWVE